MKKPILPQDLMADDFGLILYNLMESIEAFNMYAREVGTEDIKNRRQKRLLTKTYNNGWAAACLYMREKHLRTRWEDDE